ncbi:MAG: phosphopyruvate hydratase [Nanoarchaeota archaeon]
MIRMHEIKEVRAREVLDSRGNPTVEADVITSAGVFSSMVPSGASTGSGEALELRDGGKRYGGKGVLNAVSNVNRIIAKTVKGMDAAEQKAIDQVMLKLDGTSNKSRLGANAILAVSLAACRAGAAEKRVTLAQHLAALSKQNGVLLPTPMMNVINGGRHAGRDHDVQEHMLVPQAKTYSQALQMGIETYHVLKKLLKAKQGAKATLIGDEGGFVPDLKLSERLDLMMQAAEEAGYGKSMKLALDVASSELFSEERYCIDDTSYSAPELVDFYKELCKTFPLVSIEDGMAENDWEGWTLLTKELGRKVQLVGDDLLVTSVERITKAIKEKAVNSLLLKVNQIGTVTEAIDAALLAKKQGWGVVVSHRSGETEDSFIADLCVGIDAGQSKFGAPARSDRNAKYNQLLRIEEQLGKKAKYGTG